MAKSSLTRQVVCPKCGREQSTNSPRCYCFDCRASWVIDWKLTREEFWSFNSSPKAGRAITSLAEQAGIDAKALHILFNTQWNLDGREASWIEFREFPDEVIAYAKAAGVMHDAFELDHDALTEGIIEAREKLDRRTVAAAFAASLVTRRLDQRSILGSYASSLHLARHAFTAEQDDAACEVCGADRQQRIDPNHATFRRLMWAGNVLQGKPDYVLCDLRAFTAAQKQPVDSGKDILNQMFAAIRQLPPQAGLSDLEKSIAGLFPSNKQERQVVLEILGRCGILKPRAFPSPHQQWVPRRDFPEPTHFYRKEWRSPVSCWTGADGVYDEAIAFWFGDL